MIGLTELTEEEWQVAAAIVIEPDSATPIHHLADAVRRGIEGEVLDRDEVMARVKAAMLPRDGWTLLTPSHDWWPGEALRRLDTPPFALWVRGNLGLIADAHHMGVAIVGSRASTEYGNHVAMDFGVGLANRGWTVVSGGAYGVDVAAHRGALAAEGNTICVLPCGVDRPYPAAHKSVLDQIATVGALISENPPGTPPMRHRFLARNRLIAALSAGTVVVEAAERSGSLNTARHAKAQGRRLMAVPGPVTSVQSAGTNDLIRTGNARLVTSAVEIAETVNGRS
jgi:DNA processing protein